MGKAQMDRLVAQAIELYDLAVEVDDNEHDSRFVRIDPQIGPFAGSMCVEAEVSNADGHDLIEAIRSGAAAIKSAGSTASLDVRRSMALGELARHQTALDLAGVDERGVSADGETVARTTSRRVDLRLHFNAATEPDGSTSISPVGFMENHQRLALLSQVRQWVGDSHTQVRILPVIDLNEQINVDRYEPSERLKTQIELRDPTCVFPWCNTASHRCDKDHVVPFDHDVRDRDGPGRDQPGPTSTDNLGSLCRSHHRLKTHGGWQVTAPQSGVFVWSSPYGQRFRRDRDGTTALVSVL